MKYTEIVKLSDIGEEVVVDRTKEFAFGNDNNGWIKIESEDDLPETELDVHFVFEKGKQKFQTFGVWDRRLNSFWSGAMKITGVTHYQPIIKPLPPKF